MGRPRQISTTLSPSWRIKFYKELELTDESPSEIVREAIRAELIRRADARALREATKDPRK